MRLNKHHLFLLLPPTLILATWYWTMGSSSAGPLRHLPRLGHPSTSIQPVVQGLDWELERVYRHLHLHKPTRVYPAHLTDKQKRRFAGLRAPYSRGDQARTGGQTSTGGDESSTSEVVLRPAAPDKDEIYFFASNLLNAAAVLVSPNRLRSDPRAAPSPAVGRLNRSLISLTSVLFSQPDIIASLVALAIFLGPKHVFVSIVEGPSTDGTGDILEYALVPTLLSLGVPDEQIVIRSMKDGDLDWNRGGGSGRDRIEVLAELRNVALEPLVAQAGTRTWVSATNAQARLPHELAASHLTLSSSFVQGPVVFFNDVLFSAAHVLELLHRHKSNEASQTCAWDVLYNP